MHSANSRLHPFARQLSSRRLAQNAQRKPIHLFCLQVSRNQAGRDSELDKQAPNLYSLLVRDLEAELGAIHSFYGNFLQVFILKNMSPMAA
jgi:hypothetical protein